MTFTGSAGSSGTNIVHRGEAGTGPFMLTLCRLVEPVSIRPPQSPHLRPFTFFTSRAREPDGSEQLYLHMGFFETLTHAEKWARAVRGRHPDAIATITPPAFWQLDAEAAAWRPDGPPGERPSNSISVQPGAFAHCTPHGAGLISKQGLRGTESCPTSAPPLEIRLDEELQ